MQDANDVILYHKLKQQSPNNIIQAFKVYYHFGELLNILYYFQLMPIHVFLMQSKSEIQQALCGSHIMA
jgi:hypothetical protein